MSNTSPDGNGTTSRQPLLGLQEGPTVFCQINVPGTEAENEPFTLYDLDEIHNGNSYLNIKCCKLD